MVLSSPNSLSSQCVHDKAVIAGPWGPQGIRKGIPTDAQGYPGRPRRFWGGPQASLWPPWGPRGPPGVPMVSPEDPRGPGHAPGLLCNHEGPANF